MATPNRAQRRREQRARRKHNHDYDPWVGIQLAWAENEDALPEARQRTHDHLIASMGANRTGGVKWSQLQTEAGKDFLNNIIGDEGNSAELNDYYRRLYAHLREYGGWLVVATAEGRRP